MAIADTARLIAALELQDKFSKTADKFDKRVGGMERSTSRLGKIGGEVGRGLGTAATRLTGLGVAAAGLIGASVVAGIHSLERLEQVTVATNTVIESTGGIAGVTAEKVRKLAEQYESLNATIDDKVIQSGENLLLTFTNISDKAFEPALKAALDMNEAMGGGEEGLQNTIIRLGKALQDPIKGATALRKVGVNLSEQQRKQIKTLVEQNDLYGAQRIILDELATEFGGRFAAAGDTATGKFAKFRDAIEDAQASLATAFLPVLGKVAEKITTFLSDPTTLTQIQGFGQDLADGFEDAVTWAGKLDWDAIKSGLTTARDVAKIVLDTFLAMPPWVQTAVITGWGLNKLTGGALGNIVGELGKGLIKGVLGMNAGIVNINAAVVKGPGGIPGVPGIPPVAGIPAIGAGTILAMLGGVAGLTILIAAAEGAFGKGSAIPGVTPEEIILSPRSHWGGLPEALKGNTDALKGNTTAVTKETGSRSPNRLADKEGSEATRFGAKPLPTFTDAQLISVLSKTAELGAKGVGTKIEQGHLGGTDPFGEIALGIFKRAEFPKQGKTLVEIQNHIIAAEEVQAQYLKTGDLASATRTQAVIDGMHSLLGTTDQTNAIAEAAKQKQEATNQRLSGLRASFESKLSTLIAKDTTPRVTVNVSSNVSITDITRRLISSRKVVTIGGLI
jgi:tail length tape measure protein